MPVSKKQKEEKSQSVKVSINLGETKKPKKPRGKRKPSQKKLQSIPMINPRTFPQAQYSQQPQYIPLYVNQYPSYSGMGTPNYLSYMNSGIPANPQLLAGTSTAPLLLGSGTTTPTTSMTRMTSNAKFNIPQSFYVPAEKPNYPRIDIKKRIEDIKRPKLITQDEIPNIGDEEFEQRRQNLMARLPRIEREERVNYVDPRTGLLVMPEEQGRREGVDYILLPPGGDPEDPYNEIVFQNVIFEYEDDADEGFFDAIEVDGMPVLEQINFV